MSTRGRSESPGIGTGCKSRRSDSQESKYSGDVYFNSLEEDDYRLIDQTVELQLEAEFNNSFSRYRTSSPPSSPGKRKVDELGQVDDQQFINKLPKPNVPISRSDSLLTTTTGISSSGSESPPSSYPPNVLHIVAFSPAHQQYFDRHLPWGAQWEIARLVSSKRLKYDDISMQSLTVLHGKDNQSAAAEIERILCSSTFDTQNESVYRTYFAKELLVHDPWAELDLEEKRLKEDSLSGLGCKGLYNDWYGGKIAFTARVKKEEERSYFLQLEQPELSTSTRFARRWGSRRFIRVRIPDDLLHAKNNDLITFFKQDFVIHGRIFRSLYSKEHTVFLVELAERTPDGITRNPDLTGCLSFPVFLEWHNPMHLNKSQTLAKWCARMALGLSNSVPGLMFQLENIHEIDDEYSLEGLAVKSRGESPDSKFIFTDGTGYCNYTVLSQLRDKFGWDRLPSAIQFRMFGAKGLLILHPTEDLKADDSPQIWLRPSQKKIKYERSSEIDRAHLILDVLRRSEFRNPARLSTEIIVNLAENGVTYETLQDLMNIGLDGIAAGLTTWSGTNAMPRLWMEISKINGSVFYARAAREAAGKSRLLSLKYYDRDEEESKEEEQENGQDLPKSKANWANEISGCPAGLEETAMVLLDAGFEPQSCGLLANKLKEIFKKALCNYIDRYKIVVPKSGEGWMVPDPYGVLEQGQIFIKTSRLLFEVDNQLRDHLTGPVLITRHPCRVPSDVQKVEAVWRDELARYTDVIICSTRGDRSLASMLGGGDYDGDTAHLIWEPRIVREFQNADSKYADPPPEMNDAFLKDTKTVEGFLHDSENFSSNQKCQQLQEYLLSSLKSSSLVGRYSGFHNVAVYRFGYHHDEAWRLAYMFCAVLDSSKTGKAVKPIRLVADQQRYDCRPPRWKETLSQERDHEKSKNFDSHPGREIPSSFIMDMLKEHGRKQYDAHFKRFEDFLRKSQEQFKLAKGERNSSCFYVDPALTRPADEFRKRAKVLSESYNNHLMLEEIQSLENHVLQRFEEYKELLRKYSQTESTRNSKQERQGEWRKLSLSFSRNPKNLFTISEDEAEIFKASFAYELDSEHERRNIKCAKFPFDMAMRNICLIKARSLGLYKVVSQSFYQFFEMSNVIDILQPSQDAGGYIYTP